MMKLSVSSLVGNYKELLAMLTVDNPEYKSARFFGKGFVKKDIPKKLFFFRTDDTTRSIKIPRNIDDKYFNGDIEYSKLSFGNEIQVGYNSNGFKLRPHQDKYFQETVFPYINSLEPSSNIDILLNGYCGCGKCHTKGTEILMYDGSVKKVEDIIVGDLLMGDDSTPRKVLSLARGKEELYEVIQNNGLTYGVNKSHILSLQKRRNGGREKIKDFGTIQNISVEDYLKLPKWRRNELYGYSKEVNFKSNEVDIDPYFLGAWLGDGASKGSSITTHKEDTELIDYYYKIAEIYGLKIRVESNSNNSNNYHLTTGIKGGNNILFSALKKYNLINNKHIPNDYIVNNFEVRLQLLAGLLDTDGYLDGKANYSISQKNKTLTEDIKRLCWSLGFKVTHRKKIVNSVEYQVLHIKGNNLTDIPVKLERKKVSKRTIFKDASVTGIKINSIGFGDYYGFELDGNHLYMLKDSTITHNTVMSLYLSSIYRRNTIVCVTTKKIGKQFIQAINELFPNWTCGWAEDKKSYDITLGTYALLSSDNYTEEYFSAFGHIILDEFHRCGADTYSRVLEKAPCKYRTSLTATFRRKDGLHKILRYHAGKVLEMEKNEQKAVIYPIKTGAEINEDLFRGVNRFATKFDNLEEYSEICVKSNETKKEIDRGMVVQVNKPQGYFTIKSSISMNDVKYLSNEVSIYNLGVVSSPMIDTEVSENEIRTDIIVYLIREAYRKGRKTIVLSKRKEQLYSLAKILTRYGIDNGVFVSDKAPDYKKYCEANGRTVEENAEFVFNKTRVILGIDKLAEEGMDAPKFDTLIYAHPIKDIEQSIGRILRENPEGNHPAKQSPIAFYLIDKINSYNKSFYGKKDGAKQMFEKLGHKVVDECTIEQLKQIDF